MRSAGTTRLAERVGPIYTVYSAATRVQARDEVDGVGYAVVERVGVSILNHVALA